MNRRYFITTSTALDSSLSLSGEARRYGLLDEQKTAVTDNLALITAANRKAA